MRYWAIFLWSPLQAVVIPSEAEPWAEPVEGGVRVVELFAAGIATLAAVAELSVLAIAFLPWSKAEEGEAEEK